MNGLFIILAFIGFMFFQASGFNFISVTIAFIFIIPTAMFIAADLQHQKGREEKAKEEVRRERWQENRVKRGHLEDKNYPDSVKSYWDWTEFEDWRSGKIKKVG